MENKGVLAVVGTKELTAQDVEFLLKTLNPQHAAHFNSEEGKKQLLEELINQELFYLDAVNNNLDKDAEFVAEIEKMKENYLKQYAIAKLLGTIKVDDEELHNYYDKNKANMVEPESVKASHILVDEENAANDIMNELNNGLSFEEAAEKYSKCPSKSRGGDLGFFTKGQMVPEFENAAFEMELNVISEPVKTQFGYHIIKVTDKKEASEKTFEEVKDQLMQHLLQQKQHAQYATKVNELAEKYEVKRNM